MRRELLTMEEAAVVFVVSCSGEGMPFSDLNERSSLTAR
jgi:hypothetical protein